MKTPDMKTIALLTAALISALTVAAGMWVWQQAPDLVLDWGFGRPDVAEWGVRSAAVAAIAAAQLILLTLVVGRIYRRGTFDSVLAFAATAVLALASVSAIACGFAGR
jgi:hypothetical protein